MPVGAFPLENKTCVVTGGGSGISLAFVRLAVAHRANVIIADIHQSPEVEELIKTTKNVVFTKCDVANWEHLRSLIQVSENAFGQVPDVYVAGAGVFQPAWSNFWSDTEIDRYASIDINLSHPIKLTRIAMRALLSKNKPGVVLIVSSVAGLRSNYAAALYCATKHALVGFSRSMGPADEDEGIKVVCICPGIVNTPLWTASHMSQFSVSSETSLSPSAVADAMAELIQEEKYSGGTVMQISVGVKEVVKFDEASQPASDSVDLAVLEMAKEKSYAPIREILARERGNDGGV